MESRMLTMAQLDMHATQNAVCRPGVIVLDERLVNASIGKLVCVPGFHQETVLISEYLA